MSSSSSSRNHVASLWFVWVVLSLVWIGAGCGDSRSGSTPNDVSLGDLAPDTHLDVGDTNEPAICLVDEACRQALALGPCEEARCVAGACERSPVHDQMPCDDGDPCTENTRCDAGACTQGELVVCDDGNPCTVDACHPVTGCAFEARTEETACDDGDPCTADDQCTDGVCEGQSSPSCACVNDEDCAAFEDDNLCNGTLRCEGGGCRLDPGTVVSCPNTSDCSVSACTPSTGACDTWPATNGVACDDGDPCSLKDSCQEGSCSAGEPICACAVDEDCATFQQFGYNLCLGSLICVDEACVPALEEAISCEGLQGPCLQAACLPSTGSCETVPEPDGTACPAEGACATPGACAAGICMAIGPACDDGDPCTSDLCQEDGSCLHEPFEGPCDDGDPCTMGEQCSDLICQGGTPTVCDDLNACTQDSCAPAQGGCLYESLEDGSACNSGDPCQEGGACLSGECTGLVDVICLDEGPCTESTCVPGEGCVTKAVEDGVPCSSGDPCQQEGTCASGLCETLPVSCNDGNPCTLDTCVSELGGCGQEPVENDTPCTSSDPCMEFSACLDGVCTGGAPVVCEDGPCDTRSCDSDTGICEVVETAPNGSACSADDPCDTPGSCDEGVCYGESPCDEAPP